MRLQVTLALLCVLFPKAPALKCYQCIPGPSGTCTDTQTDCPDQCGSWYTLTSAVGQQHGASIKTCATAAQCASFSLNLGVYKMTARFQCCNTDLCNSQNPTALSFGSPNGKTCYTCTNNDCTGILSCEGDADQCITLTDSIAMAKMKGCASKSVCTVNASSLQTAGVTGAVSCCSGSLCNGAAGVNNNAAGVSLSLFIMLIPLFPILFL